LGAGTFRRRISRVEIGDAAAAALAPLVDEIARSEGFPVHGESALARADRDASGPPEQAS
jgi:histidinol dehydrogenase